MRKDTTAAPNPYNPDTQTGKWADYEARHLTAPKSLRSWARGFFEEADYFEDLGLISRRDQSLICGYIFKGVADELGA